MWSPILNNSNLEKLQALYHVTLEKDTVLKIVRIRNYSGPYFSAFGLNTDQNNSEYEHFLRSESINQ